jgi:hypothetical protein
MPHDARSGSGRPAHAEPQHPHGAGPGGAGVRPERGGAGALWEHQGELSLQPADPARGTGLGAPGAAELGHELFRGLTP